MKYSTKLSDAVHTLAYIYLGSELSLSSTDISVSIQTNPAYVRQLMAKMKAGGILQTTRGQAKPTLTRAPEEISLLDVYRAVEGDKPLLHLDTHVNPECNIGVYIQYALRDYYDKIQRTAEADMASITLKDIIDTFHEKAKTHLGINTVE